MCSDMPNMPKEANKAKCFVVSCFVLCAPLPRALIPVSPRPMHQHVSRLTECPARLSASSIFSMMGFFSGPPGVRYPGPPVQPGMMLAPAIQQ